MGRRGGVSTMAIRSSVQGAGTETLLSEPGALLKNTTGVVSGHWEARSPVID